MLTHASTLKEVGVNKLLADGLTEERLVALLSIPKLR